MRRILVENARRRERLKRGGGRARIDVEQCDLAAPQEPEEVLALDGALTRLAAADPQAAKLVKLRYFAGLSLKRAAEMLGVAPRTADFLWAYAKAYLLKEMQGEG